MPEPFERESKPGDIENLWTSLFKQLMQSGPGYGGIDTALRGLLSGNPMLSLMGGGGAFNRGEMFGGLGRLARGGGGLGGLREGSAFPALQAMAGGNVPTAVRRQFRQNARETRAGINEQFGTAGARLGTDIAGAQARQGRLARTDLAANAQQQALAASQALAQMRLGSIGAQTAAQELMQRGVLGSQELLQRGLLGALQETGDIGTNLMNIDVARAEGALERMLKRYGIDVQAESGILGQLLQFLLSQSGSPSE